MLVLMSVDRSVATLIPARSMTRFAALIAAVVGTVVICVANSPTVLGYGTVHYELAGGQSRTACVMSEYDSTFQRFVTRPSSAML